MKKHFEIMYISKIFKIQIVTLVVQKQKFYKQFEIVLKANVINGFKIFKGTFTYKLYLKIFSLKPSNLKNTRNLFEILQK